MDKMPPEVLGLGFTALRHCGVPKKCFRILSRFGTTMSHAAASFFKKFKLDVVSRDKVRKKVFGRALAGPFIFPLTSLSVVNAHVSSRGHR